MADEVVESGEIDDLWDGPRFEVWDDFLYQIEEDGYADQWSFDFDRCPDPCDPVVLAANRVASVAEQRVIVNRLLWDQPPPKWQMRRWGLLSHSGRSASDA